MVGMLLYHGSRVESFASTFGLGRERHDYGRGFYLTESLELAREWAVAANPYTNGWVHAYELDLTGLRILDFATLGPLPWLAELMKHRDGDSGKYYRESAPKFIERYGDDYVGVMVGSSWIMSNSAECQEASGSYTPLTSGYYPVEFRVGNNRGVGGRPARRGNPACSP